MYSGGWISDNIEIFFSSERKCNVMWSRHSTNSKTQILLRLKTAQVGVQENKESALCIKPMRKCRCLQRSRTVFIVVVCCCCYCCLHETRSYWQESKRQRAGWKQSAVWLRSEARTVPEPSTPRDWARALSCGGASARQLSVRADTCSLHVAPATWRSQASYPHSSPAHQDVPNVFNWSSLALLLSPFMHPVGTAWLPCFMLADVGGLHPTFPHPAYKGELPEYHTQCSLALTLKKNFSPKGSILGCSRIEEKESLSQGSQSSQELFGMPDCLLYLETTQRKASRMLEPSSSEWSCWILPVSSVARWTALSSVIM